MSGPRMSTTYLGLDLPSPVVASASPLNNELGTLAELEASGAGAVVLPSLFAEEIEAEEMAANSVLDTGDSFAEFDSAPLADVPMIGSVATDRHVTLVADAKRTLSIPVIASLNGTRPGDWSHYGGLLAEAGADALELNLYDVAADPARTGADVENGYLEVIAEVKEAVGDLPLALKISPYLSSLSGFAPRAHERAPTPWCCSTASTGPTSTSPPWPSPRSWPCRPRPSCHCACAGPPFLRPSARACRSPSPGASTPASTW